MLNSKEKHEKQSVWRHVLHQRDLIVMSKQGKYTP